MLRWFAKTIGAAPCEPCAAKTARIMDLEMEVSALRDIRDVALKLEELARLDERRRGLQETIETLRLKHRADEKARREIPSYVVDGKTEGRLPPL